MTTTIETTSHVGADGLLRLTVPVELTDADVAVTIILKPAATKATQEQWEQFVRRTCGAWKGEAPARPEQGFPEERLPLD